MTRTRRAAGIAVLLAGALVLAGCTPATVCDRRETSAGKYQIRYQSEVDDGTERPKTSDWITLDKAEYDACQVGDKWPQCKKDAKEEPEVNEPRRDPRRDEQDRNARTVCFDFVSEPKRKLTYKWSTPRREEGPRTGTWGIYSKCVDAQVGQAVNMKVEHVTGPSTLLCTIYVMRGGKKVPIDMMITQAFGDCDVAAVVPPN
jgi:hypothetical protein